MTDIKRGAEVRLSHLVKAFGSNKPSVDDVSLNVEPGEFVTFLGPSGSGKTTTLNMIAGFVTPTSGSISVDGAELANRPPHRRDLGMVFQQYALFPHMSVYKNVAFPLEQRRVGKSEIKNRVATALEQVRLEDMPNRLPASLSGGQQQRVALARALVFDPPVLLMDEPFGALDKGLREELQVEMSMLHRRLGTTFIFVTHDQDEAMALSDRVAVFNQGRIEQEGTPQELYERPATRFVAQFLGESNLFTGRVSSAGESIAVGPLELRLPTRGDDGGEITLMVRPERIRLLAPGEFASENHNLVSGRIESITYVGASARLTLQVPGQQALVVRSIPDAAWRVGDEATAAWAPGHSSVLGVHPRTSRNPGGAPDHAEKQPTY